ncbi:MAG TPA: hypothetical protein VMG31_15265 [Verrucomicrobiae bacterium]|nr:hypothetical protein [Verrucomicrobiae bacterium]
MAGTGVLLALNEEEAELLQGVLEERDRILMFEIARTDHRAYKITLQKQAEVLESVLSRLPMHA